MSKPTQFPRFVLELEALPRDGPTVGRRLARLLKAALRSYGFRCVDARELPSAPAPDPHIPLPEDADA